MKKYAQTLLYLVTLCTLAAITPLATTAWAQPWYAASGGGGGGALPEDPDDLCGAVASANADAAASAVFILIRFCQARRPKVYYEKEPLCVEDEAVCERAKVGLCRVVKPQTGQLCTTICCVT